MTQSFWKKVYISVDGAEWLKAGKEFSRNSELVLDRFPSDEIH